MRRLLVGLAIYSIAALSPCWAQADDQQIAQQIVKQLRQQKESGQLAGFGIDLEVDSGIVWLKGHVSSAEQQQAVLDIARHIEGVEQVVNDLSIKETVTTEKKPGLLSKPKTLFSSMKRRFSKSDADEAAKTNDVAVPLALASTKKSTRQDGEIAKDVISKLRVKKDAGELRNFGVDVQVNEGVVWISGRVASKDQQTLVLEVARRIRGVKQVVNDISITKATPVKAASTPIVDAAPATPAAAAQPTPAPIGTAAPQAPAPFAQAAPASQVPLAFAPAQSVNYQQGMVSAQPVPEMTGAPGIARARFDHPTMPGYAWPSYAAHPNYGAVTYPRQYSPTAWPYIGPFYPYPQVPLGWRKVQLEWDDGWWFLNFKSK
jgi:osmotically-inducible protein OsmY